MQIVIVLCTVFALFGLVGSVYFAWRAGTSADACEKHAKAAALQRAKVVGLEGALDSLHSQHLKLRGQFHAFKAQLDQDELPLIESDVQALKGRLDPTPRFDNPCENYLVAQRDGPTSPAAQCECVFCEQMRAQRRDFRAAARAKVNGGVQRGE